MEGAVPLWRNQMKPYDSVVVRRLQSTLHPRRDCPCSLVVTTSVSARRRWYSAQRTRSPARCPVRSAYSRTGTSAAKSRPPVSTTAGGGNLSGAACSSRRDPPWNPAYQPYPEWGGLICVFVWAALPGVVFSANTAGCRAGSGRAPVEKKRSNERLRASVWGLRRTWTGLEQEVAELS